MKKDKVVYVVKSLSTGDYLKSFNGMQFEFTDDISEAKYFKSENDAYIMLRTKVLGCPCLPHCSPVIVRIAETNGEDED